jgi:hypothetical protein
MQVEHCENEKVLESGTLFMPSDEIPLTSAFTYIVFSFLLTVPGPH